MARVVGKGNADGLMEGGNSGNSPPSPTQTVTQINHLVCPLLYTIYGGRIANLIKHKEALISKMPLIVQLMFSKSMTR